MLEVVLGMRVEGVARLCSYRPFVAPDALAHVIFLFEMEHRRLRLHTQSKQKQALRDDASLRLCPHFSQSRLPTKYRMNLRVVCRNPTAHDMSDEAVQEAVVEEVWCVPVDDVSCDCIRHPAWVSEFANLGPERVDESKFAKHLSRTS